MWYALFLSIGVVYPFVIIQIEFAKNATLLGWWEGSALFAFKICLATIGVAFLSAVTSVAALFYFMKEA